MGGVRPILAVAGLVDHHGTVPVRCRERVGLQFLNPAPGHRLGVPLGFGQEELQLLDRPRLRLGDRLGADQGRQRLVAVAR